LAKRPPRLGRFTGRTGDLLIKLKLLLPPHDELRSEGAIQWRSSAAECGKSSLLNASAAEATGDRQPDREHPPARTTTRMSADDPSSKVKTCETGLDTAHSPSPQPVSYGREYLRASPAASRRWNAATVVVLVIDPFDCVTEQDQRVPRIEKDGRA